MKCLRSINNMFSFIHNTSMLPDLSEFPLSAYSIKFAMNRLSPGVDNVRFDVRLSPTFCNTALNIITQLIARHFNIDRIYQIEKSSVWNKKLYEFKNLYSQVMRDAVNKAKLRNEPQIDYLAQIAVVNMLRKTISNQVEIMNERIKNAMLKHELRDYRDIGKALQTKESLSNILQNKESILRSVGKELFRHLTEIQNKDLNSMREANFGAEFLLPDNILENSIFHTENPFYDAFLIDEYDIVLGRRMEDSDQYDTIISLIRRLLGDESTEKANSKSAKKIQDAPDLEIEELIKQVGNIDILLNWFQTKDQYRKLKNQNGAKNDLRVLKARLKAQKKMLSYFYRNFKKIELIDKISASYEMRSVYQDYCPPLVPQQIILFIIGRKTRKSVTNRLKRLKKLYNQPFSLKPLRKKIRQFERLTSQNKKGYLIRFLNGIARFHRDLENYNLFQKAMERINLTLDEKIIKLSRANNTLYEFLLPNEQNQEEKPIINHVVIKADVRGSTDITHQMNKRKLNPASYFSLNFFNPISDILSDYGALKVFIEGDAIILSIFERENTPEACYSVARACGIAINMLLIIRRYNEKSKKNKLPILELGIGINYRGSPPTFLFDEDHRIMISSAINLADRQSSCSKWVRNLMEKKKPPFNLYVYQTALGEEINITSDDLFARYNVNGIELNASGFKKLSEEINLKVIECNIPKLGKEKIKIYTGKFPTKSGKYQRLIIREALIPEVSPEDLTVKHMTDKRYYEICLNPKIYKYAKKLI